MQQTFERIAIVNRGEAAMRFIHAVREFNFERGTSLRTIALYTEPDQRAMFVREADEAWLLGAANVLDATTRQLKSRYADYSHLAGALVKTRAEAVWVGWGIDAEHAQLADLCREMGIAFIGPEGDVIRRLGDKIWSKRLAEQSQIAVADWSNGPVETISDALRCGDRLGYPLCIKAAAGAEASVLRQVNSPADLENAFENARSEAMKKFGDPTIFMEKIVAHARLVEVQVIADCFDNVWAAGVRDCTIQRRHKNVLEEAPSPALTPEQDESIRQAAVRLTRALNYHNAGTVEFLCDPARQRCLFTQMYPSLRGGHAVTECATGLDLVKLQVRVSRGERLDCPPPKPIGNAIEVRLKAEDPEGGFALSPGRVRRLRIPSGLGIRVDTGVEEGDNLPSEFDPMVAKIIGFGRNREEALSRLQRVLRESVVVVEGGTSNRTFLVDILNRPEVKRGDVDLGLLDRLASKQHHQSSRYAEIAVLQAAIEACDAELNVEREQFFASALRGRPQVRTELGRTVELRYGNQACVVNIQRASMRQYRLEAGGIRIDADVERIGPYEYSMRVLDRRYHIVSVIQGAGYRIEVDGVSHRVERGDGGVVRAPSPAVVVSINVKPGDIVDAGEQLAVLEAMKMEMQVVAPFSGRVRQVMAIANVQVSPGTPLLQIEPSAVSASRQETDPLQFSAYSTAASPDDLDLWKHYLAEARQLMLGFEINLERMARLLPPQVAVDSLKNRESTREAEDEVLGIFVDLCGLFRQNPKLADDAAEAPSTESYLFSYLRTLDTHGEKLPQDFLNTLARAVGHYGVRTLDRSPELESCLLWIYKSHQRIQQQVAPISRILESRLQLLKAGLCHAEDSMRLLLERMISSTRDLFPALSDLARELKFRCFDQPMIEAAKREVYTNALERLEYLEANSNAPDRHEKLRALIECPQPLAGLFSRRFATATPRLRQLMLEIMISRYYSVHGLHDLRAVVSGQRSCVTGQYQDGDRCIHVFTDHAEYTSLRDALSDVSELIGDLSAPDEVILDVVTSQDAAFSDPAQTSKEILQILGEVRLSKSVKRVVVGLSGPDSDTHSPKVYHFTFDLCESRYQEVPLFRGVHPMIAERLNMWRVSNFNVTRLPSAEEILLVHAVAKENPKDERLFAAAEVRDLTPVRNKAGKIVHLPHLEQMFAEAVAAMRAYQSRRDPRKRLYWNRIFLYVWPTLTLKHDEVDEILHRLAPQADGLGLEQVVVRVRIPSPRTGELRDTIMRISAPGDAGLLVTYRPASKLQPMRALSPYDQKVVKMRQRGLLYPYEIIKMLTPSPDESRGEFDFGKFVEMDLDGDNKLVAVARPYGENKSNIIVGQISNFTVRYPEGMKRVILLGDPSRDLGAIAEPECRRIIAALELAEAEHIPVEWFTLSAGAKISMDSGVENMDWIALVLRRLVEFTQRGGEINLIVNGINVGAQPYWNAEATMLMHTRGILIMTPKAAMVLTGKRALDYSGSVSAEDNQGIGGYDRIMGYNGQAQYFARDIDEACKILMRHYEHAYVATGERFPRRATTNDPADRDVRLYPHSDTGSNGFTHVGDIFSDETNPGRKKSFDIRKVMLAVSDQDHEHLERWAGMRSAETTVIWDAHLGGYPVCMIGIQSKPVPRFGFVPADGPDQWTAGTLFPLSSKKVARAINSASHNRPVVVIANLSGFDGSPESMRRLQLEYGAEIGRAVVNFKGPMIFCVISRYHGGAYVVFSRALNENLEVVALEGTYASVIGGAPAAAVVFAGEVEARAREDRRLQELNEAINKAQGSDKAALRSEYNERFKVVHSQKLGEVAAEFDQIHSVHRALKVGALSSILPPRNLRPFLIDAVERGMSKFQVNEKTYPSRVHGEQEALGINVGVKMAAAD
jgi:acetyl/propionyl-CoA carboxylase alpha subunit/acetyl-CoA carboxylase carboxyltransferase component